MPKRCHSSATVSESHRLPRARAVSLGHRAGLRTVARTTTSGPRPDGRFVRAGVRRSAPTTRPVRGTCRPGVRQSPRRAGASCTPTPTWASTKEALRRDMVDAELVESGGRGRRASPRSWPPDARDSARAASASSRRSIAAAAVVETDQGTWPRRSSATRSAVAEQRSPRGRPGCDQCLVRLRTTSSPVAARRRERLGLAGHGVHERLVDDDQSARAAAARAGSRPGAGRPVGLVGLPIDDEVGVVRDRGRVEREPVAGGSSTLGRPRGRPARARRAAR